MCVLHVYCVVRSHMLGNNIQNLENPKTHTFIIGDYQDANVITQET